MKIILYTLLLVACASCSKPSTKNISSQVLSLNLSDDPVSLDPRLVRSLKDLTVVKQLYEGLMRLDEKGIPQPALASSVEISDDLLTYTFHLREAFWSHARPITAHDFVKSWKQTLSPSFASDYAYMLYHIKHAEAKDTQTLVVTLHAPTPYFLELTAFPTLFPVRSEAFSGPFCLEYWKPQTEIVLKKNPLYWDSQHVTVEKMTFSIIADSHTEGQLFEKGDLDWLGQPLSHNISPELLEKLKKKEKLESYPVAGTLWFTFNTTQQPFDNPNIRKAFCYSIDRAAIVTHLLCGHQIPASTPIPRCMAMNSPSYFSDHDVEMALTYFEKGLAEKGWTRETFPRTLLSYTHSERDNKIVQYVQQQWSEALGIRVELQALEGQVCQKHMRQGLHQIGIGQWIADFSSPLAFLEIFKHASNGINNTGWEDPIYNSLLEANLLQQAEAYLMDAMPIAPLYHFSFDYAKKPYVQGVILSPYGIADFKTAYIQSN